MDDRAKARMDSFYIAFGCLNVAAAVIVSIGGLFSSLSFAFYMAFLVDLPLVLGLAGMVLYPRISGSLMVFGCVLIMVYLMSVAYFDVRAGFRPVLFHVIWFMLNISQIVLAFVRIKQVRQTGASIWPQ
jgi:hypothetical protein